MDTENWYRKWIQKIEHRIILNLAMDGTVDEDTPLTVFEVHVMHLFRKYQDKLKKEAMDDRAETERKLHPRKQTSMSNAASKTRKK